MYPSTQHGLVPLIVLALASCQLSAQQHSSIAPPLSPEDSIATMQIADGYTITPVLTEPQIHEPSAVVWDGNGRMYVVEMRTYMQDIDGQNQLNPVSRVSRHEDTDGDGIYDKHSVFADNLSLPRMILPLLDRVIIRETNTLDLKSYQDTDDDGVADKIELWHEGGNRGGNLEHQPSGLIWNIDNWIYTTYSAHRYRFTNGQVERETMPHGAGQWGLTHDDVGRVFYSTAGGENPASDFQQPIIYGKLSLRGEQADGFREVFPIARVPDTQGGRGRLRENDTLNNFTCCCGQSIYRGDRLPQDMRGDLMICEPVGRLIRRAKVTNTSGGIVVSNAYDQKEFIAATDPNFRPVNTATGPDGCLYVVDMYRGIIQEGNWVRSGSYLRGVVKDYELQKNIGRGRVYRIDHPSSARGPQPRMLDETPAQLVAHLEHPNGWWRSEAQKLIILHADQSVIPALESLARSSASPLGRLHALWTLEGLSAVDYSLLTHAAADEDYRVRAAAMRILEPVINDRRYDSTVQLLARDTNSNVLIQVLLSVSRTGHPNAESICDAILASHSEASPVAQIGKQIAANREAMLAERKKLEELRRQNALLAESMVRGKTIYNTLCTTCHGESGKGKPSPNRKGQMLAPPLDGSPRVLGHKERLTRILLQGLIGPVDDKTYDGGLMLPMSANGDEWIADVSTYIRNSWSNRASLVEAKDIARIREDSIDRMGPWTLAELKRFDPPSLNRKNWVLTASHNADKCGAVVDGDSSSRWDTGSHQKPDMWFGIELPEAMRLASLSLDTRRSKDDYPRGFAVYVSSDGKKWGDAVAKGQPARSPITNIELDTSVEARFIRIHQTGVSSNKYWSIHELSIAGMMAEDADAAEPLSAVLSKESPGKLASDARKFGDARRGSLIFHNQSLACTKCHEPGAGKRLGPDLSARRDGVTDTFLVDSVLNPSKDIRKGYEPLVVQTESGLVIIGYKVSENDETLVVREPASGKDIAISQDEIYATKNATVSPMPVGLVNQLNNRNQFLDLVRFLIDINEGGKDRLEELQKSTITKSQ